MIKISKIFNKRCKLFNMIYCVVFMEYKDKNYINKNQKNNKKKSKIKNLSKIMKKLKSINYQF